MRHLRRLRRCWGNDAREGVADYEEDMARQEVS